MTLAERLRAAKQRIETEGWCQGDEKAVHGDGKFGCCAATAMLIDPPDGFIRELKLVDLFRKVNGLVGNIAGWNDAPERTLEDVLAAYDKAIAAAEQTS